MGSFKHPASNVDVGPTILGLAGLDGYSFSPPMDGKSIAPLIVDHTDPAVLPVTREHILTETAQGSPSWRTHHFVEYYSLGNVKRTGHLVDDPKSNTYRALRFTSNGPVGSGNMLYAEFTAVTDWNFKNYTFVEIFDVEKDPHQLTNIASKVPAATTQSLHNMLQTQWECSGKNCEVPTGNKLEYV